MTFPSLAPAIIAIDGPAASGKSTIGFHLAEQTNFLFFDTGVMYRAVTWAVLAANVEPSDQERVGEIAETTQIDILPPEPEMTDGRQNSIVVGGTDITWLIRMPEVDQNVSFVAANPVVRTALTTQQRRIAQSYGSGHASKPGIIMVGRDMGTVVVPDAPLKIYLSATAEARAIRRHMEQLKRKSLENDSADGSESEDEMTYEQVLEDIRLRDQRDSERTHAPLRPADDAHIIDTSNMTIDEVMSAIIEAASANEDSRVCVKM